MSDLFNPKFRVKFLRSNTINRMSLEPGNFMVDMDTGRVFIDILASNNQPKRITLSGFEFENYYNKAECDHNFVTEGQLQDLINQLDEATYGSASSTPSIPSTIIRRLTTDEYEYAYKTYPDWSAQTFTMGMEYQGTPEMPTWGTDGSITRSPLHSVNTTFTYPKELTLYVGTDNFIGAFFNAQNTYTNNDIFLVGEPTIDGNVKVANVKIVFNGVISLASIRYPRITFERYSGNDPDTSLYGMKFAISYDQTEPYS